MVVSNAEVVGNANAREKKRRDAKKAINKLLRHLNIDRVISIDDDNFREPSFENFKELCIKLGTEGCQTIPELQALPFDDLDILAVHFDRLWNKLVAKDKDRIFQELYSRYDRQSHEADMETLEYLLGELKFLKLSLGEWRTNKTRLLEEAKRHRTLFLFDQNFEREGESTTAGIESIKDVLSLTAYRDVVMCGLLSRTFGSEEEHYLWQGFAEQEQIDPDRFVLISKRRLHEEPLGFARMVKLTVLNRDCRIMKEVASQVIHSAQSSAEDEVKKINIYDFEHIVFQSSYLEGVWEPDTLFRLYGLFHRSKAREEARNENELREVVARIRSVSNTYEENASSPKHSSWKIQRLEYYQDERLINTLNMPIEVGDIFETSSEGEIKKFILLAQPCDLMVRSNGKRNRAVTEVILAEIVDDKDERGKLINVRQGAHYELPYFLDDGSKRFVSFRKRYSVKLSILDLCAYQQDGMARFSLTDICSDMIIPSWKVHFDKVSMQFVKEAIEQYEKVVSYCQNLPADERGKILSLVIQQVLSLPTFASSTGSENLFNGNIDLTNESICYELRRVGRFCQPYSGAMLTSFAAYLARSAFDHDFGKDKDQESE